MRDAVLKVVREIPDCSFVNLCRAIPGAEGEEVLHVANVENLILWTGLSRELHAVIVELEREGEIQFKVASLLSYAVDGFRLPLPIAKRRRSYASPRWLPVHIHLGKHRRAERP